MEELRLELQRAQEDKARLSADAEALRIENSAVNLAFQQSLSHLEQTKEALAKEKASLEEALSKSKADEAATKRLLAEAEAANDQLAKEVGKVKQAQIEAKHAIALELTRVLADQAQAHDEAAKLQRERKKSELEMASMSRQAMHQVAQLEASVLSSNATVASLREDLLNLEVENSMLRAVSQKRDDDDALLRREFARILEEHKVKLARMERVVEEKDLSYTKLRDDSLIRVDRAPIILLILIIVIIRVQD